MSFYGGIQAAWSGPEVILPPSGNLSGIPGLAVPGILTPGLAEQGAV